MSSLNFPGENWEPRRDQAGWEAVMCTGLGAPGSSRIEERTWDMVISSPGEWGSMHTPRPMQLRLSIPLPPAPGFGELLGAG